MKNRKGKHPSSPRIAEEGKREERQEREWQASDSGRGNGKRVIAEKKRRRYRLTTRGRRQPQSRRNTRLKKANPRPYEETSRTESHGNIGKKERQKRNRKEEEEQKIPEKERKAYTKGRGNQRKKDVSEKSRWRRK